MIYENISYNILDKPEIPLRPAVFKLFEKQIQCIFEFLDQRYICSQEEKNIPLIPHHGVSNKTEADYAEIQIPEVFFHVHSSSDAVYSITLMQNESQYEWLDDNADRLSEIFCLLSQPGMMSLIRYLHMNETSKQMTLQYIANQTGCNIKHIQQFLDLMHTENHEIETLDGVQKVYSFSSGSV